MLAGLNTICLLRDSLDENMKRRHLPLLDIGGAELMSRAYEGWNEIIPRLGQVHLESGEFLQMAVLGARQNLLSLLHSSSNSLNVVASNNSQSAALFSYKALRAGRQLEGELAAFRTRYPSVYLLMFVTPRTHWRAFILPLIDRLYPKAAQPFLTQIELHSLLSAVQKATPTYGLRVLELSAKKKLRGEARKRFQSTREWTDESLESAFREARQAHQWFQSVTFEMVRRDDEGKLAPSSRATVSKYGYIACDGDFNMYSDVVLNRVVQIASERLEFFSKRDRISSDDHVPKPVRIEYDSDVLNGPQDTGRLAEALRRFKYGSCTVLHSNPYLHVSVVDNRDFSTAEIWVLSPREVLIMPQVSTDTITDLFPRQSSGFHEIEISGMTTSASFRSTTII
jgi:hypothetical protein